MSKGLGGNIGCKDKTSSWYLNGFPNVTTSGQQYNIEEKPSVIYYCTLALISMHRQEQQKQVPELY